MPIGNVINILIKDSDKHFDKNIVDVFLNIPLDKVITVFLTENHNIFKDEDRELLSHYNLKNIYDFINAENLNENDKNILELFNFYYSGNIINNEG